MAHITIGTITITDLAQDGATISFEKDAALLADFKLAFPKARWAPVTRVWGIPGKLATKRATTWADGIATRVVIAAKNDERICRDADFDGRLHEVDPGAAIALRRAEFTSKRIRISGATVVYDFAYNDAAVAIARTLPGAKYNPGAKSWAWTAKTVAAVTPIIEGSNRIHAIIRAAREAEHAAQTAREAARAAEQEKRDAERAANRANRILVLADNAPAAGEKITVNGEVVTVEGCGKIFRADENTSSLSDLIGCEGRAVRYAYFNR